MDEKFDIKGERFMANADGISVHTVDKMICRDCRFVYAEDAAECDKFYTKPLEIIKGEEGASCPKYEKA